VLEGGPGKGVRYDNIVDSNGNVLIQEDETAFGDVMTAENRDAGIWSYNTASDKVIVFELDENAAGAQFNDPEEPGNGKSGIVEVEPNARPGKQPICLMFRLTLLETPRF